MLCSQLLSFRGRGKSSNRQIYKASSFHRQGCLLCGNCYSCRWKGCIWRSPSDQTVITTHSSLWLNVNNGHWANLPAHPAVHEVHLFQAMPLDQHCVIRPTRFPAELHAKAPKPPSSYSLPFPEWTWGCCSKLRAKDEQGPFDVKRRQGGHVGEWEAGPGRPWGFMRITACPGLGLPGGVSVSKGVGKQGGVFQGSMASPRTLPCPWGTLDTWVSL